MGQFLNKNKRLLGSDPDKIIAKLGKWHDSKRNGRVGIPAFWKGWIKLGDLIESYEMFKGIDLE